jgi:phage tail-like protein
MNEPETEYPIILFRFDVMFQRVTLGAGGTPTEESVGHGSFSECTGLEATMEPKVIKSGGSNYGPAQRVGPVTFGTVVLKRGITSNRDLWNGFSRSSERGFSTVRFKVSIAVKGVGGNVEFTATLQRALPIKFKCGDLNARTTEVGIEELHLAHEGLTFA